jgi:hypothetical protein
MDVFTKNNNITRKYSLILLESKDKWEEKRQSISNKIRLKSNELLQRNLEHNSIQEKKEKAQIMKDYAVEITENIKKLNV